MKNIIQKILFKIFYIIAVILVILFIGLVGVTYFKYNELCKNPLIEILPYSIILKMLCIRFLVPAVIFLVFGFTIQRLTK